MEPRKSRVIQTVANTLGTTYVDAVRFLDALTVKGYCIARIDWCVEAGQYMDLYSQRAGKSGPPEVARSVRGRPLPLSRVRALPVGARPATREDTQAVLRRVDPTGHGS